MGETGGFDGVTRATTADSEYVWRLLDLFSSSLILKLLVSLWSYVIDAAYMHTTITCFTSERVTQPSGLAFRLIRLQLPITTTTLKI